MRMLLTGVKGLKLQLHLPVAVETSPAGEEIAPVSPAGTDGQHEERLPAGY